MVGKEKSLFGGEMGGEESSGGLKKLAEGKLGPR